jgi:hypothetical protein
MGIIRTTYETITQESAEDGEVADSGWIDEEGESMGPADAIRFLRGNGAIHASSSRFHPGVWYSTDAEQDYCTDEWETRSYHLSRFTLNQQRRIWEAVTGRKS